MAKPSGMTAKPPEPFQDIRDDLDYREPWDQAGSKQRESDRGRSAKDFHFREAGVQRFNDCLLYTSDAADD